MRSPVRSLPPNVGRWASRARWLRWLDALAAWLLVWGGLALTPYAKTPGATAVAAAVLVGLAALVSPIRRRWRPRLVVARPDQDLAEGLEVRRTRVLVVPAPG